MSETKTKKKKPGNTRIYEVPYILNKYNLTPEAFQELAQELFVGAHIKHVKSTGISSVGLMMIGKEMKARRKDKANALIKREVEAPIVRELIVCGVPPNKNKLWCKCPHTESKVVVNVLRKVHESAKLNQPLICERINDGLFVHPPMVNA